MKTLGLVVVIYVILAAIFVYCGEVSNAARENQQKKVDSFSTHCTENKGHLYQPSTIVFCLTEDGRMLEVYP